jgi:hypothetical protein
MSYAVTKPFKLFFQAPVFMVQHVLVVLGCLASLPLASQTAPILMGMGNVMSLEAPPESIHASDGVYDKFVLVRWEPKEQGEKYRLFRATSANGGSMRELTKSWQKSTWFCDYTAEKGQDYYYAVMESDGQKTAPLSRFDKGFLRKSEEVAYEDAVVDLHTNKYAAGKVIFALVAEVSPDSAVCAAQDPINLVIGLQNIFEESAPRTELRIYLSQDAVWDFEDILLTAKTYSGFPAKTKATLQETCLIPKGILPGSYHILVIASPEGDILNAKTGSTPIIIARQ